MAENNNLIPTEPDWDGTPMSRSEEILYSIIHTEEWDGTPMSRGEYFLVQLKDAIENISMMDIKGTVPTVADLPSTGNKKGDVYSVGPEEQLNKPEYYWDGEAWQYLGQIVDLSGYLPLTGGTMTGNLDFSIGGKTISIGVSDNETQIISGNSNGPLRIASKDIVVQSRNGEIVLQAGTGDPAIWINRSGQDVTRIVGRMGTEMWSGWTTTIESDRSTTIKGHRSNSTDTNTITLNSTGIIETTSGAKSTTATGDISETTLAKKVVTTATGIELGTTSVDNTVSVSTPLKKLSVTSPVQMDVNSGGNLNVTGYGNVSVTATAGNLTETANGNTTLEANNGSSTIFGKQGVAISAGATGSSIGYVTATHGATVPASDSTNKVATTAIAHAIANSKIGTVSFGTCSSAADAVAKTVTVTNFPGLVDGATITVLFENTNTAINPTLNVNNSGAQPIMKAATSAVGPYLSSSWMTGGVPVSLIYVQNAGWILTDYTAYPWVSQNNTTANGDYRVLMSNGVSDAASAAGVNKSGNLTFNPSTKALTATDGKLYMKSTNVEMAVDPQSTTVSNGQILYTDNNETKLFQIYHQTLNTGTKRVIFEVFNTNSGGDTVSNLFTLTVSRAGVCTYTIKDPAKFCDAIGLGSVLQDISNIQATIGDINTVLEEVL